MSVFCLDVIVRPCKSFNQAGDELIWELSLCDDDLATGHAMLIADLRSSTTQI